MLKDELGPWMEKRGWQLEDAALERLETLLEHWQRYGRVTNLSSARTRAQLLVHVKDGLDTVFAVRGVRVLTAETVWLDVGSGGGFPGLVVAAVTPGRVVLVEPRQKRAAFLELAASSMRARTVTVRRRFVDGGKWDARTLGRELLEEDLRFDVASARAVMTPERWREWGLRGVARGGHVVLHLAGDRNVGAFRPVARVFGETGWIAVVEREGRGGGPGAKSEEDAEAHREG